MIGFDKRRDWICSSVHGENFRNIRISFKQAVFWANPITVKKISSKIIHEQVLSQLKDTGK